MLNLPDMRLARKWADERNGLSPRQPSFEFAFVMALPKKPNRDADKEASCKAHEPRDAGSQGAKASEKDRGCAKQDN